MAKALRSLSESPLTREFPLLIIAVVLTEDDLPKGHKYEAFLQLPEQLDLLVPTIARLLERKESQ